MRHALSIVLAGSLLASVAHAQEPPTAAQAPTPAVPAAAVASGSVQGSATGSTTASSKDPSTTVPDRGFDDNTRASGTASTQDGAAVVSTAPAKPARRAARRPKKRTIVKGPVANFPAFRIQPDGSSRIHVQVSEKVIVAERKAEGRLTYRMKGASVPVRTNLLPLETSFFSTPVARVMLAEAGDDDVELIVELRQPSVGTYKVVDTDAGIILQVDFPAPAAQTSAPPQPK